MNTRVLTWLCAGLAATLAGGCSKAADPGNGGGAKKGRGPVAVRTARVERRNLSETMLFTGELESPVAVEVKPKIQGRLEKMEREDGTPTTEGAVAKRGETIAEIDGRELDAQVALAEAQARQAEIALEDRARERRRFEALFAEEVATEQARDAAATAHESAKAALAQAQAQLELAKVNRDETRIRAPMDGVVTDRHADPGAMVGPSTPIVRMAQMDPLRLMLAIPARLLPMLEEGRTAVSVATDVLPGREFDCTVSRIFPAADPATRTVRAEVLLPNPREDGVWRLRPGMYATARLTLATSPGALTVAASSIVRVLDRQLVYVVRDAAAVAATVRTGVRDGDDVEILEGLAEGDEYVAMGQNKLTDGAAIERVGEYGTPVERPTE